MLLKYWLVLGVPFFLLHPSSPSFLPSEEEEQTKRNKKGKKGKKKKREQ
jgi:hypothetical protein